MSHLLNVLQKKGKERYYTDHYSAQKKFLWFANETRPFVTKQVTNLPFVTRPLFVLSY